MLSLLKFEVESQVKTRSFWVVFIVFCLIGFGPTGFNLLTSQASELRANINGAQSVSGLHMPFIQIFIFLSAILTVNIMLKDDQNKFADMVHVTPISKANLLIARFFSVFLTAFLWLCGGAYSLFLAQYSPLIPAEHIGPVSLKFYLQPLMVYSGLSLLFLSAFYTSVAWVSRSQMAVYVAAIAAFAIVNIAEALAPIESLNLLRSILDFTGGSASADATKFWSIVEQETRLTPFEGSFGRNRIVWIGLSLVGLIGAGILFRRRDFIGSDRSRRISTNFYVNETDSQSALIRVKPSSLSWPMFKAWFQNEFISAFKSLPYLALVGLALVSFMIMIFLRSEFHPVPLLPTSNQVVFLALNGFSLFLILSVIFFSASITWRDHTTGLKEILDVTPSEDYVHLCVKWAVVLSLIGVLLFTAAIFTVIAQIILGNLVIEFRTIFVQVFLSIGLLILFFTILTLFLQTFVKDQKMGLLASASCALFFFFIVTRLPFYHPLIDFGRTSFGAYSDMNGFEGQAWRKGVWLTLYWTMISGALLVLSLRLWPRGLENKASIRLLNSKKVTSPLLNYSGIFSAAAAMTVGGFIFYHINIRNDYETAKSTELKFAKYEKLFGDQFNNSHPVITDIKLNYDLFPSQQRGRLKGTMALVNQSNAPIENIVIALPSRREQDTLLLSVEGADLDISHRQFEELAYYQYRPYKFDPPLDPGQTSELIFEFAQPTPGIGNKSPVRKNGTFVTAQQILPQLGFEQARITNKRQREKHGLGSHPALPERENVKALQMPFYRTIANHINYEATLCTDLDQIAMTPGQLIREYTEKGRRCFDYATAQPILPHLNIVSGRYAALHDNWNGIDLSIYYHPSHAFNVDTMMAAMKGSLDYISDAFGPYQFDDFRVLEFPYGRKAESFAGTVSFSENVGFIMDVDEASQKANGLDFVTYVTAHEIAHQWFGHQIVAARVKGHSALSESLSEHAASESLEALRDWPMAKRMRDRALDLYLSGRIETSRREPPLALAERDPYVFYQKGHLAFWALKHTLGKDAVNAAIRDFVAAKKDGKPPYATTVDIVSALKAKTAEKHHRLIDDYFERIVLWKLAFSGKPEINQISDNQYSIAVAVQTERLVIEPNSRKPQSSDLDEYVEIGFFEKNAPDTPFRIDTVHITNEHTDLSFEVDRKPSHIMLDPRGIYIERNEADNMLTLNPTKE